MATNIKCLIKKPNDWPAPVMIDNYFKSFQQLVDGPVEIVPFPGIKDLLILLNEEGKLNGLTPNVYCPEYADLFVGNIVVVAEDGDSFRSLTEDEILNAARYLNDNSYVAFVGGIK